MDSDNAVIKPLNPKHWPPCVNRTAVMVSSPADLKDIVKRAGLSNTTPNAFLNSRMYCNPHSPANVCIAGPFTGAPYAVMLLETLVAWGIEKVIVFGWCGSVCEDVRFGDLVIPVSAFPGDGTSPHYCISAEKKYNTLPSGDLTSLVLSTCRKMAFACHEGPIWTMDAIFRETPEILRHYRENGALAVEMETAALFAASAYRCIEIAAVLAVSDEVHTFSWKTGFGSNVFKQARKNAIELILAVTEQLDNQCAGSKETDPPQ